MSNVMSHDDLRKKCAEIVTTELEGGDIDNPEESLKELIEAHARYANTHTSQLLFWAQGAIKKEG